MPQNLNPGRWKSVDPEGLDVSALTHPHRRTLLNRLFLGLFWLRRKVFQADRFDIGLGGFVYATQCQRQLADRLGQRQLGGLVGLTSTVAVRATRARVFSVFAT